MRQNDASGLLLSFSGIDGVGKTTQIDLFREKLIRDGLTCIVERFSLDDFGQEAQAKVSAIAEEAQADWVFTRLAPDFAGRIPLVQGVVYDSTLQTVNNGAATTMMFAGGSLQVFENCIAKLLDVGVNVVCDRYWFDELAFRGRWLEEATLLSLYDSIPLPNIAFYFDAAPSLIYERNRDREDGKSPFMQSLDRIAELRQTFLDLSACYGVHIIDADRPKDELHASVLSIIDKECRGS